MSERWQSRIASVHLRRRSTRVRLEGELDIATRTDLASRLTTARKRSSRVVVDLRHVTFLDASTIGTLQQIDRLCRAEGGALTVRHVSDRQRRVFCLVGAATLLS